MDVCAKIRGVLHERRVGHAGTLDPMATGVLPVFVGRATRAVEFASESEKEYIAGLKLGVVTNTQDTTGQVVEERPVEADRADLEGALAAFRGEITQIPPMYSALKRDGKKLYELARAGKEVERAPRPVTIQMCIRDRACRVVVPDDQLSLAIGKEGQNARLAAKLTGWKIDIKPASAPADEEPEDEEDVLLDDEAETEE